MGPPGHREGPRGAESTAQSVPRQLADAGALQDARIWRRQVFVQKPVFARQDVAGYTALRTWSEQFYEAPEGPSPTRSVIE